MATFSDPSTYLNFLISPRIPPELVLKTIQHLPFNDGSLITTIRSAHPRLRAIFRNYERSITGSFMKKELRHAETDFKCGDDRLNVDWLADCVHNYDIVDDVMDALCSEHNFNAVLQHNVPLANAGLLLLYRLTSIGQSTRQPLSSTASANLPLRRPRRPPNLHQIPPPRPPGCNLPRPPPRHPLRPLPRLRLDKPTHLRPLHGRKPSRTTQRTRILLRRSGAVSRSGVHLRHTPAPRYLRCRDYVTEFLP